MAICAPLEPPQSIAYRGGTDAGYFVGGDVRPGAHSAADDYLVCFIGAERLRHPAAHQRSVRFKLATGYRAKDEHLAARFASSSTVRSSTRSSLLAAILIFRPYTIAIYSYLGCEASV